MYAPLATLLRSNCMVFFPSTADCVCVITTLPLRSSTVTCAVPFSVVYSTFNIPAVGFGYTFSALADISLSLQLRFDEYVAVPLPQALLDVTITTPFVPPQSNVRDVLLPPPCT